MTANGYTGAQVSMADVEGLDAALAGKADEPVAIADVTGLQTALDGKADDPVAIADVTGLQTALDGKLPLAGGTLTGSISVATGGTAINAVDRAALINFAAHVLRTAGVDRWSLQMTSGGTNDLHLTDSANGTTALLVEPGATAPNVSLLTSTKSYGGGAGVVHLANATTAPTTNPTGGGILYAESGVLKHRSSSGATVALPDTSGTLALNELAPVYAPSNHGLLGWAFDPSSGAFGATALTTQGLVRVARIRVLGSTLTNIHFHLTVGGSALTSGQCFAAVYNDAGALLGAGAVTASLHSTGSNGWGDGGFKTHPLTVAQAVTPGAFYRVAWWYNGTTGPTLTRGSANGSAIINANLSASAARYATANTSITTTAPANLTGLAGDTTAWWVAVS